MPVHLWIGCPSCIIILIGPKGDNLSCRIRRSIYFKHFDQIICLTTAYFFGSITNCMAKLSFQLISTVLAYNKKSTKTAFISYWPGSNCMQILYSIYRSFCAQEVFYEDVGHDKARTNLNTKYLDQENDQGQDKFKNKTMTRRRPQSTIMLKSAQPPYQTWLILIGPDIW